MSEAEELNVTVETDKPSYAAGEVPQYAATVKTKSGDPVYADLQWGLRFGPDGEWVDYSREYPVHTNGETGEARWRWPDDEYGPPDSGEWGLLVPARAYDDAGNMIGEGEAELTYRIGD